MKLNVMESAGEFLPLQVISRWEPGRVGGLSLCLEADSSWDALKTRVGSSK